MCYSSKASIIAYLVNLVSSIILFRFHRLLGLFWGYIGVMQLFDFIFWNSQEKSRINFIFTKIAMFINLYQPLVLALLILYFNRRLELLSAVAVFLYLGIATTYIIYHWNEIDYTLVTPSSGNSLDWKWATSNPGKHTLFFFYMLSATLLFWGNFPSPLKFYLIFIIWFTLLMTKIFHKSSNIGRFWCNVSAYIPLFLTIVVYYQKKSSKKL